MSNPLRVPESTLAAFELFSSADLNETAQIQPCPSCAPWFLEAQPVEGGVLVREWHDEDCPHLGALLADDLADAD